MGTAPLRYRRLIREIPKHKTAKDALLASGFSESVANTQAKRAISSAIKYQAKEILETQGNLPAKTKQLMSDLIGLSREELFATLKKIATQDKDYGSALKVLGPISKQHDIILNTDDDSKQVNVPILNIVVDKTDTDNMAKNIEPVEHHELPDSQEQKDGSVEP